MEFIAILNPSDELCSRLEALNPTIPYCTKEYRDAITGCGREPWFFGIDDNGSLQVGCIGEVARGRLRRGLHIQSTPKTDDSCFWDGLRSFSHRDKMTTLSFSTVCTNPDIPEFNPVSEYNDRYEYWVDLDVSDLVAPMRYQQRRAYRRAAESGLLIRQPPIENGLNTHSQLTTASLGRRRERGERIPVFSQTRMPKAIIESGLGRIYECVFEGEVIGSVILTLANHGVHGYSAGFSKEGLKHGAGVFLNLKTFEALRAEGKKVFNLGDAPEESGLAMFKRGIGGQKMPSRAAKFDVSSGLQRALIRLQRLARVG